MPTFARLARAALTGAVLAAFLALGVLLPKCEGSGPHPWTGTASVTKITSCTTAYGQCEVTTYRLHKPDGTVQLWTCYAQPPVKPGASNIWIAVSDCFRP